YVMLVSLSSSSSVHSSPPLPSLHSFPTRRSSDLVAKFFSGFSRAVSSGSLPNAPQDARRKMPAIANTPAAKSNQNQRMYFPKLRSEEHTSELQSRFELVCRLLLEKKNIFAHLLNT